MLVSTFEQFLGGKWKTIGLDDSFIICLWKIYMFFG